MKLPSINWESTPATLIYVAVAFAYLYLTLFRLPATPVFFENDHFIQMYDAVRIMDGQIMYRDFFQFTFPGTAVWYTALFALFGQKIWLVNATIVLLGLMLTWTLLAISKKLMTGVSIYIAPSLFLFFGFRWFGMDGGHRLFSCLFATLAILVILQAVDLKRLALAGTFAAMSAFFTQNRGVGIAAAIIVFLAWFYFFHGAERSARESLSAILTFGLAFSFVLFAMTGYFMATAGPAAFVESTMLFARNYNADPINNSSLYFQFWSDLLTGRANLASLPVDLFYFLLVPTVYIVSVVYMVRSPAASLRRRQIMLLSSAGLFLFLVTTGLSAVRLYHVSIPGLALFALFLSRFPKYAAAITGLIVVAAFGLAIWGQVRTYPPPVSLPTGTVVAMSDAAAERFVWIDANTDPGDYVFESFRSVINFPLMVQNPTSVPMLRDNNYTPVHQAHQVLRELTERPPKYILWNGDWSKPTAARSPDDNLGPIFEFLQSNYTFRVAPPPIYGIPVEIWERKHP